MKTYVLLLVVLWNGIRILQAQQDILQLKTIFQPEYHKSFELSGLAQNDKGEIFMIQDEDEYVYLLDSQKVIQTKYAKGFEVHFRENDWEGIDIKNQKMFVLSEKAHTIIGDNFKLKPDFAEYEIRTGNRLCPEKWGNAGFEGFCYADSTFFLAKERNAGKLNDGRYVLEINQQGKILRQFSIPELENIKDRDPDFSDIKYAQKGKEEYLYLLERNYYCVTRLNLNTMEFVRMSYAKYVANSQLINTLYHTSNPQFGMAEALLLTESEIWIGFDNNHDGINTANLYAKKYKLHGNQCIIMRFERGNF